MNKKKRVEKNTNCNSFLPVVISVPSDKISFSFDGHIIEVDSSINDDALCRVINALEVIMISFEKIPKVYIACGPTDLRKGIDGYAYIIQDTFKFFPFSGCFVYFL